MPSPSFVQSLVKGIRGFSAPVKQLSSMADDITVASPRLPTVAPIPPNLPGFLQGKKMVSGGESDVFFDGGTQVYKWLRQQPKGGYGLHPRVADFFRMNGNHPSAIASTLGNRRIPMDTLSNMKDGLANRSRLPSYNLQGTEAGTLDVVNMVKQRNLVPEMPQNKYMGELGGRPLVQQPRVQGNLPVEYRDVRDWFRRNNVVPLRKGNMDAIGHYSKTTGKAIPARAGIARVNDPLFGFIPRSKYLLMDDLKPGNFKFDIGTGTARPIDVSAQVVPRIKALMAVPQLREEFIRRLIQKASIGGGIGLGAYGVNQLNN